MHSHQSSATEILNNNIKKIDKGKSCLKFMHFPFSSDNSLFSWIAVWNEKTIHGNNEFSLRILDMKNREFIYYFNFSKEIIKAISLNELVKNNDSSHYIVQLNSSCANYSASVLTYNSKTHQTACDHTSGG